MLFWNILSFSFSSSWGQLSLALIWNCRVKVEENKSIDINCFLFKLWALFFCCCIKGLHLVSEVNNLFFSFFSLDFLSPTMLKLRWQYEKSPLCSHMDQIRKHSWRLLCPPQYTSMKKRKCSEANRIGHIGSLFHRPCVHIAHVLGVHPSGWKTHGITRIKPGMKLG